MFHYEFRQWLSFFYLYCIFGWCFESTYVSLKQHCFVNRGFLKGPWLPLYGSGAVLVLLITMPFDQLLEQVMDGTIEDAKTVAGVLKTKVLLKL